MGNVSIKALLTEPQYVKPLGIVLVLMGLQQLSGINYVLSYSTLIFEVFFYLKTLKKILKFILFRVQEQLLTLVLVPC